MSQEPLILETKKRIITLHGKEEANTFADQGYTLHTYTSMIVEEKIQETYVMVLEMGYSDVTRVADASEDEANLLLALGTGWEVASTSVSSKFYRMIKRTKQPNLPLIRELLTHIFNIAEDNDTKDPSIMDQVYRLSDKALRLIDGENTADAKQVGVGS